MEFKAIIASVKPNYTDEVVDAAKTAGATGATIIQGRGTGIREAKSFFGLSLEAQTDIILFLTEQHTVKISLQLSIMPENFTSQVQVLLVCYRLNKPSVSIAKWKDLRKK